MSQTLLKTVEYKERSFCNTSTQPTEIDAKRIEAVWGKSNKTMPEMERGLSCDSPA